LSPVSGGYSERINSDTYIQGTILEHPDQQVKLGQKVRTIGTGLFAIGVAYVIGCLTMAMV
jgi:hypothetical protein